MPRKPLLTAASAARVLQVTPATVRAMTKRGALKIAQETESGVRLFDRKEVEKLARKRLRFVNRRARAAANLR